MVDYANLRSVANRLIVANGRSLTVRKLDRDPDDTAKPWRVSDPRAAAEWEETVTGVFIEPSTFRRYGFNIEDMDLIKKVEAIVLIPAAQFGGVNNPGEADEFIDNSSYWKIIFNRLLAPGPTELMWVMGGRR